MEILNDSVKSFEKLYLQLQDGFPVIVPTDTNYNLCSLPNNDLCIDKIFEYKKRSKDKPLSLLLISQRIGNCMEIIKIRK